MWTPDVTKATENISPGWKARESYRIFGPDKFRDVFDINVPRQGF
jgi:hypothetical protein